MRLSIFGLSALFLPVFCAGMKERSGVIETEFTRRAIKLHGMTLVAQKVISQKKEHPYVQCKGVDFVLDYRGGGRYEYSYNVKKEFEEQVKDAEKDSFKAFYYSKDNEVVFIEDHTKFSHAIEEDDEVSASFPLTSSVFGSKAGDQKKRKYDYSYLLRYLYCASDKKKTEDLVFVEKAEVSANAADYWILYKRKNEAAEQLKKMGGSFWAWAKYGAIGTGLGLLAGVFFKKMERSWLFYSGLICSVLLAGFAHVKVRSWLNQKKIYEDLKKQVDDFERAMKDFYGGLFQLMEDTGIVGQGGTLHPDSKEQLIGLMKTTYIPLYLLQAYLLNHRVGCINPPGSGPDSCSCECFIGRCDQDIITTYLIRDTMQRGNHCVGPLSHGADEYEMFAGVFKSVNTHFDQVDQEEG